MSGSRLKGLTRCYADKSASQSKLVINELIHTGWDAEVNTGQGRLYRAVDSHLF